MDSIGLFAHNLGVLIFTARKRSLGQGNIFSSVCQEFCTRGEGMVVSQHALQVVFQHALQQVSGESGIPACLAGFQAHTQGVS